MSGVESSGLTVAVLAALTGATVEVVAPPGAAPSLRPALGEPIRAAAIDSRLVGAGDLFVALPGARTDGARFAADACARGAFALLTPAAPTPTPEQWASRTALGAELPAPVALVVPDPLAALQKAATAWRASFPAVTVVGVTGSVGKTTTREAIATLLALAMPVLVSPRSYNNEIGLPLTLLGLRATHRAAVLEMGMYTRGDIAALASMAAPRIGVVTMVAPEHLETAGSLDAIAAGKAELVEALPSGGVAVLNGDDARVRAMAALTAARAVFFGLGEDNDWRATAIDDKGLDGLAFTLVHGPESTRVETPVVGRHLLYALLAAAAVAETVGLTFGDIVAALPGVRFAERQRIVAAPRGRLVIDDAWNASPPSMLAALDVLATIDRRRVAVLGEMREMGAASEEGHRVVGRRAGTVVDALVTVGPGGAVMAEEALRAGLAGANVVHVAGREDVPAALDGLLRDDDAVLVKGSRALALESVVDWLIDARAENAPLRAEATV